MYKLNSFWIGKSLRDRRNITGAIKLLKQKTFKKFKYRFQGSKASRYTCISTNNIETS